MLIKPTLHLRTISRRQKAFWFVFVQFAVTLSCWHFRILIFRACSSFLSVENWNWTELPQTCNNWIHHVVWTPHSNCAKLTSNYSSGNADNGTSPMRSESLSACTTTPPTPHHHHHLPPAVITEAHITFVNGLQVDLMLSKIMLSNTACFFLRPAGSQTLTTATSLAHLACEWCSVPASRRTSCLRGRHLASSSHPRAFNVDAV